MSITEEPRAGALVLPCQNGGAFIAPADWTGKDGCRALLFRGGDGVLQALLRSDELAVERSEVMQQFADAVCPGRPPISLTRAQRATYTWLNAVGRVAPERLAVSSFSEDDLLELVALRLAGSLPISSRDPDTTVYRTTGYDAHECVILMASGLAVHWPAVRRAVSYVRISCPSGNTRGSWDREDWESEPEHVLSDIVDCLTTP